MSLIVAVLAFAGTSEAQLGGPVIIGGDDADEHGSYDSTGEVNLTGWLYIEEAFRAIGSEVDASKPRVAVCLGCNGSPDDNTARGGFESGFDLSDLPPPTGTWSRTSLTVVADLEAFFDGTGTVHIGNVGLIYLPSDSLHVGGGITEAQLAVVAANAADLDTFVRGGGGLFSHSQGNLMASWLGALLPDLVEAHGDPGGPPAECSDPGDDNTLELTVDGSAAFSSALTNATLSAATPWHSYFGGDLGGLNVLATGPCGGTNQPVILGGSFVTILPSELTPAIGFNPPGTSHRVTATLGGSDVDVEFRIVAGPNSDLAPATPKTDSMGVTSFRYQSDGTKGADTIEATFDQGQGETTLEAVAFWDDDCNENEIPDTCELSCEAFDGECSIYGILNEDDVGPPCSVPVDEDGKVADEDDDRLIDSCDEDKDGVPNSSDNCTHVYNPDQADRDDDRVGDACPDNCVAVYNPEQEDANEDGVGDACEGIRETILPPSVSAAPGEPIWLTAIFENGTEDMIYTMRPDCYNTTFTVLDANEDPLPPRYRMRTAYGIPDDVVPIGAGDTWSVTCDLSEMFHPQILTSGPGGAPITYKVAAINSNYHQDEDRGPDGICSSLPDPCFDLFHGSVKSVDTESTVVISGAEVPRSEASCSAEPDRWSVQWENLENPPRVTLLLSGLSDPGAATGLRLNGSVAPVDTPQVIGDVLSVQFAGDAALASLGTPDPESKIFPRIQGTDEGSTFTATCGAEVVLPLPVKVDIKPGSEQNTVNLGSNGVIPVAILGSASFNAAEVDATSVRLAGASVRVRGKSGPLAKLKDVNGDGHLDLEVKIETDELELSEEDTEAFVTGITLGVSTAGKEVPIEGSDHVRIVPGD